MRLDAVYLQVFLAQRAKVTSSCASMPAYLSPSPTAINLVLLCPARACGSYVAKIKDTFNDAARKGVRGHKLTQEYLRSGTHPKKSDPLYKAVQAMIRVLPVVGGSVAASNIERSLLLEHRGVEYTGYMDWEHKLKHGDLKFTGNVSRFAKLDPYKDVQRIVYSADWFERHNGERKSASYWTVAKFDGSSSRRFKETLDRKKVKKALDDHVSPAVDQLLEMTVRQLDWQDQPKNPAACHLYHPNGCPMRTHGCKVDRAARLEHIKPKPALSKALAKEYENV